MTYVSEEYWGSLSPQEQQAFRSQSATPIEITSPQGQVVSTEGTLPYGSVPIPQTPAFGGTETPAFGGTETPKFEPTEGYNSIMLDPKTGKVAEAKSQSQFEYLQQQGFLSSPSFEQLKEIGAIGVDREDWESDVAASVAAQNLPMIKGEDGQEFYDIEQIVETYGVEKSKEIMAKVLKDTEKVDKYIDALGELKEFKSESGYDIVDALTKGIPVETLQDAGYSETDIDEAVLTADARRELAEYVDARGDVDIDAALAVGVSLDTIKRAGYSITGQTLESRQEEIQTYLNEHSIQLNPSNGMGYRAYIQSINEERAAAIEKLQTITEPIEMSQLPPIVSDMFRDENGEPLSDDVVVTGYDEEKGLSYYKIVETPDDMLVEQPGTSQDSTIVDPDTGMEVSSNWINEFTTDTNDPIDIIEEVSKNSGASREDSEAALRQIFATGGLKGVEDHINNVRGSIAEAKEKELEPYEEEYEVPLTGTQEYGIRFDESGEPIPETETKTGYKIDELAKSLLSEGNSEDATINKIIDYGFDPELAKNAVQSLSGEQYEQAMTQSEISEKLKPYEVKEKFTGPILTPEDQRPEITVGYLTNKLAYDLIEGGKTEDDVSRELVGIYGFTPEVANDAISYAKATPEERFDIMVSSGDIPEGSEFSGSDDEGNPTYYPPKMKEDKPITLSEFYKSITPEFLALPDEERAKYYYDAGGRPIPGITVMGKPLPFNEIEKDKQEVLLSHYSILKGYEPGFIGQAGPHLPITGTYYAFKERGFKSGWPYVSAIADVTLIGSGVGSVVDIPLKASVSQLISRGATFGKEVAVAYPELTGFAELGRQTSTAFRSISTTASGSKFAAPVATGIRDFQAGVSIAKTDLAMNVSKARDTIKALQAEYVGNLLNEERLQIQAIGIKNSGNLNAIQQFEGQFNIAKQATIDAGNRLVKAGRDYGIIIKEYLELFTPKLDNAKTLADEMSLIKDRTLNAYKTLSTEEKRIMAAEIEKAVYEFPESRKATETATEMLTPYGTFKLAEEYGWSDWRTLGSIGTDLLFVVPVAKGISKATESGIKSVDIMLESGEKARVYKGLSIGGNPILGVSNGKLVVGVNVEKLSLPKATEIIGGFKPETKLETNILAREDSLRKMGINDIEISRLQNTLNNTKTFVGKKSPYLNPIFMSSDIKSLSKDEVNAVLRTVASNSKDVDEVLGSLTIKPQLEPSLAEWRGLGDIDINTKLTDEEVPAFTKKLFDAIMGVNPRAELEIAPDGKDILTKATSTEKSHHAVQVHSITESKSLGADSSSIGRTGTMSYGRVVAEPAIIVDVPNVGKVKIMSLSESGVRKQDAILQWRKGEFAPPEHRVKDIVDYYVILRTFKGEDIANAWAKKWGYNPSDLRILSNEGETNLNVWKFIPDEKISVKSIESPSIPKVMIENDNIIAIGYLTSGAISKNVASTIIPLPSTITSKSTISEIPTSGPSLPSVSSKTSLPLYDTISLPPSVKNGSISIVSPVSPPISPVSPPISPVSPPISPVSPPISPVSPPISPVSPPVTPDEAKPPIIIPSLMAKKVEQEILRSKGAIALYQGRIKQGTELKELWYVIKFPYKSEKDAFRLIGQLPKGVTPVMKGQGASVRSIQVLTGIPPTKLSLDLGLQDIHITSGRGKKLNVSYKKDRRRTKRGDIDLRKVSTVRL
jgi:hypothetical protein